MSRGFRGRGGERQEREIELTMCSPLRVLQIALSLSDNLWKLKSVNEICNSFFEEFSSVQLKIVSMRSEKPICALSLLSEVSPTLSLKQFQRSSD